MKQIKFLTFTIFAALCIGISTSNAQDIPDWVTVDTDCEFSGFWNTSDGVEWIEYPGKIAGLGFAFGAPPAGDGTAILAVADANFEFGEVWSFYSDGTSVLEYSNPTPALTFDITQSFDPGTGTWSGTFSVHSTTAACGVPETGSAFWLMGGGVGLAFAGRRWSRKR